MSGTKLILKPVNGDDLVKEVGEVEAQIREVSNKLTNPELALATSVRLSVQQRELEAYLRGILFAIGEAPSWRNALESETKHAVQG